jgi:hypothetical protein
MMLVCFIALLGSTLAVSGPVPQALAEQVSFTTPPPSPDDVVDIVDTVYGPVAGNIGLDYRAYRGMESKIHCCYLQVRQVFQLGSIFLSPANVF